MFQALLIAFISMADVQQISDICSKDLKDFPGKYKKEVIEKICAKVSILENCQSVEAKPIYFYEKLTTKKNAKNVLVFSLIHGDETSAGSLVRFWLERLEEMQQPRNNWRIIPILNPDGVKRKTRTNAKKVDLNRNFPTKDWEEKATQYWQKDGQSSPRRYPGPQAGSEPETQCAMKHITEFKPDVVVSIHTPLRLIDFDGPKIKPPQFPLLPWKSLGHYPGSLGRYMWFERETPVVTLELMDSLPANHKPFEHLQDIIGYFSSIEFGKEKK